jgi:gamma-glutamyl-gamma-aminobutyraldehyde dehydrogenase
MLDQTRINALRNQPIPVQRLFIAGQWQDAESGQTLDAISPINGQVISTLADANEADVNRAVSAARDAFNRGIWSRCAPAERKKVMHKIADLIQQQALELAVLGVRDNGTEINMAINAEPGSASNTFRYYAESIDKVYGEIAPSTPQVLGLVHREPVGVVGAIVPWNFPLMIASWKIAPALAMGNSVVLKPAEGASLSLLRLAELCAEAGLPDGVLNVVTGRGTITGKAMGLHPDIDVLAFTGSGMVGRKLLEYSAQSNLKRVYLELGGKSPNIVFANAPNLQKAAEVSALGIFRNSGQVCVAGSRLLVQKSIHDEFIAALQTVAKQFRVGDPLDLNTQIGAVSSQEQLNKDLSYVQLAQSEGAQLVTGGERLYAETGGFYMQPTIFTQVTPKMTLAQEEVFGPVLSVLTFEDEAEAVQLANSTNYGLAAAVWTSNLSTAHRMIRAVHAGIVHVNCYGGSDITVPLGGVKQSGNGVDKSLHALDKYCDLKTAWIQL